MKKLLLLFVLCFSLFSCSKDDEDVQESRPKIEEQIKEEFEQLPDIIKNENVQSKFFSLRFWKENNRVEIYDKEVNLLRGSQGFIVKFNSFIDALIISSETRDISSIEVLYIEGATYMLEDNIVILKTLSLEEYYDVNIILK